MTLKIDHKPLQGLCKKCDSKFNIEFSSPKCLKCGSEDFELMPDAPLLLEEIEFQTD